MALWLNICNDEDVQTWKALLHGAKVAGAMAGGTAIYIDMHRASRHCILQEHVFHVRMLPSTEYESSRTHDSKRSNVMSKAENHLPVCEILE
jgi:hypothetical protein